MPGLIVRVGLSASGREKVRDVDAARESINSPMPLSFRFVQALAPREDEIRPGQQLGLELQ